MKDYIVVIKDFVEDFESDRAYDRVIRVIHCKDCLSESDALIDAKEMLINEGKFIGVIDMIFEDDNEVFFKVEVYPLEDNSSILYSI